MTNSLYNLKLELNELNELKSITEALKQRFLKFLNLFLIQKYVF